MYTYRDSFLFDFSKIRKLDLVIAHILQLNPITSLCIFVNDILGHFARIENRPVVLWIVAARGGNRYQLYVTRTAAITTTRFRVATRVTCGGKSRQREGKEEGEESGERVGLFYLRTSRDKLLRRDATRWPELQFHKFEWRLPLSVMRSYCIILQSPYDVPSTFRSILTLSPRHPFFLLPFSLSFSLFLCLSAYLALSLSFTLYFASWPIHLTFSPSERGQT